MNPMLISVCREYIELYKALSSGSLDHTELHASEAAKSTLHAQLIELAADRDKVDATYNSYNYALAVIALADGK